MLYFEAPDLDERRAFFGSLPVPVVIDHMGRPDVRQSVDGPQFGRFLEFVREVPTVRVKVTCPERLSVTGAPDYADVVPFVRRVVGEFPDRVLWGTDWPHPNMTTHVPDDGALVDWIGRAVPDEQDRRRLFVDNPTRLYWGDTDD